MEEATTVPKCMVPDERNESVLMKYLLLAALAAPLVPAVAHAADSTIFADGLELPFTGCPATIETDDGPRTLLTHASISYGIYQAQRVNQDVTEWDNIWGYNGVAGPLTPWPGVGGSAPVIKDFPRSAYICAHFHTDTQPGRSGIMVNPS